MNEENKKENLEEKNPITLALEKIGVLEQEVKEEKEENKTLNQRIEDLVSQMEIANKI
jgi:FtsZ-binding cell division protein ZapB